MTKVAVVFDTFKCHINDHASLVVCLCYCPLCLIPCTDSSCIMSMASHETLKPHEQYLTVKDADCKGPWNAAMQYITQVVFFFPLCQ